MSIRRPVTRRSAIGSAGVFAFFSTGALRPALAAAPVRFREIRVDVEPLRASAGDPTAEWVEAALPSALAKALGANLAPSERSGATLVARIKYIYLGSTGGAGQRGASPDSIEGDLIVGGPHGPAANTPLRATNNYDPTAADQALIEEAMHSRVVALAQAFAGWAPRELGL
jgi:hypothetical protein